MFPDYMNDMLGQARCGHCNAPQTTADIQIVGVRRPEEFEAFYGERREIRDVRPADGHVAPFTAFRPEHRARPRRDSPNACGLPEARFLTDAPLPEAFFFVVVAFLDGAFAMPKG